MAKNKLKVIKDETTVEAQSTIEQAPKQEFVPVTPEDAKLLSDEALDAKIKEIEAHAESFGNEMLSKKYKVNIGNLKNARSLLKFLEKNVKWAHNSLPGYISVCHGLKDAINEGVSEDGFIGLSASPVGMIYQQMLQVTGTGYFEAKEYLTILTEVGSGISESMKELADDNEKLRNIHTDLATYDTEKIARSQGIQVAVIPTEEGNS